MLSICTIVKDVVWSIFCDSASALENGGLHTNIAEYLDGVRQCFEAEAEKDAPAAREQRITFADFVTELIKSFPCEYESIVTYFYLLFIWVDKVVKC